LLVIAGLLHGSWQLALWGAALAIDYLGATAGRMRGWRISPAHFVERFGSIIIAFGESIVAIGVGATGLPLDAGVLGAALLGITVVACLWWLYFDWVAFVAQARLAEATGARRAALARDAYSYLHLPMVAGIVLFAFGLKTTLPDVDHALPTVPAFGLVGGIAVYLLAHVPCACGSAVDWRGADRSRRSCCLGCSPWRARCRPSRPLGLLRPSARPSSPTRPSGTGRPAPGSEVAEARSRWKRPPASKEAARGTAVHGQDDPRDGLGQLKDAKPGRTAYRDMWADGEFGSRRPRPGGDRTCRSPGTAWRPRRARASGSPARSTSTLSLRRRRGRA
jgi:hypothetical protein